MQIHIKSLVQYKKSPAIVVNITDKIEILLGKNTTKRVREKDIILLHNGPIESLDFQIPDYDKNNVIDACELLETDTVDLCELSELIFNNQSAPSVWAVWQLVQEGIYFSGNTTEIKSNGVKYALKREQEILKQQAKKQQEIDFYKRLQEHNLHKEDFNKITDIEELALKKRDNSFLFKKIGFKQNPELAHQYLCSVGFWDKYFNPYPQRYNIKPIQADYQVTDLPDENRVDLTYLDSFAIDDEGNTDPDDAISIDGDTIWIHIADVSALVTLGSEMDKIALNQMANCYLPEGVITMLPAFVTDKLGLGLQNISPALSISFKIIDGALNDFNICLSLVKVTRISYKDADNLSKMSDLFSIAKQLNLLRIKAITLQFPEVKISVNNDKIIKITELHNYLSRNMVMEFMLAAGVVAGKFAILNKIPFVFSTQNLPDLSTQPNITFADKFALRKQMSRSVVSTTAKPHDGLGLQVYSQVTSPLRRYFDLLNHQQLRAFLQKSTLLDEKTIKSQITQININILKNLDRDASLHAKCIFLLQNQGWEGKAIIMEIFAKKTTIIIPLLALELKINTCVGDTPNDILRIKITKVDLYTLTIFAKRVK